MEETMENPPSTGKLALKWGLIFGIVLILYSLIINMTGQFSNRPLQFVSYIFFIAAIVMAHKEYKQTGDGYMSYGKGLGIGTLTVVVAAIISSIFGFIYMTMIDPSIMDMIREQQIMDMEERGMSDAQIEQAMQMTEAFTSPAALAIIGVIVSVIFGFILSLIVTAFTKNSNPELEM